MTNTSQANNQRKAYSAGLRLIARRPMTRKGLAQRLTARFPAESVQEAVAALEAGGYLNDAAFAEAWRASREAHRPRSASQVRKELVGRGIPPDVAGSAVEGMDDEATAWELAHRRIRLLAGVDRPTFYRRLGDYLRRRGFSASVVHSVVRRAWQERGQSV